MNSNRRLVFVALVALALLAPLAAQAADAAGVVNVNTASVEQLQLLPRIGAAVAQRIVEHRQASGKFASLEDLMLIKGIGERTFEQLKPFVTLSGDSTLDEKVRVPRSTAEAAAGDEGR